MAGINVQAHYDVQTRRQVCHEYFVLGWTQAQIAIHHDQHPSETTVGRIVDSYVAECNTVVVPPGSRGRLHSLNALGLVKQFILGEPFFNGQDPSNLNYLVSLPLTSSYSCTDTAWASHQDPSVGSKAKKYSAITTDADLKMHADSAASKVTLYSPLNVDIRCLELPTNPSSKPPSRRSVSNASFTNPSLTSGPKAAATATEALAGLKEHLDILIQHNL